MASQTFVILLAMCFTNLVTATVHDLQELHRREMLVIVQDNSLSVDAGYNSSITWGGDASNSTKRPGDVDEDGFLTENALLYDVARNGSGLMPDQVHLTLWGPNSYLVTWAVGDAQNLPFPPMLDPTQYNATVQYGTTSGNYSRTVAQPGNNVVYKQDYSRAGDGLTSYASQIFAHVVVKDLQPGQVYYYRVGNAEYDAWSKEYSFKAPSDSYPITIAAVADVATSVPSWLNIQNMIAAKPDLVLISGDLSYADMYQTNGTMQFGEMPASRRWGEYKGQNSINPSVLTAQNRWDMFGRMWEPLLAYTPVLTANGNHETEPQFDQTTHASFNARYPMPQNPDYVNTMPNWGWGSFPDMRDRSLHKNNGRNNNNMYFGVQLPIGVTIIELTAYVPYEQGSEQLAWLTEYLPTINRTTHPWLIVMLHATFYQTFVSHFKEVECQRQIVEPLLFQYNVDLIVTGHTHGYERTRPMYNYALSNCGIVNVLVGGGGQDAKSDFVDTAPPKYCNGTLYDQQKAFGANGEIYYPSSDLCFAPADVEPNLCYTNQPEWSAYREVIFGYGLLEIQNATHATWGMQRAQDPAGEFVDMFTMIKLPEANVTECISKTLGTVAG